MVFFVAWVAFGKGVAGTTTGGGMESFGIYGGGEGVAGAGEDLVGGLVEGGLGVVIVVVRGGLEMEGEVRGGNMRWEGETGVRVERDMCISARWRLH